MRNQASRVDDNAAYVLHATPWRETSLIARIFSRDHGSLSIVAKGAKRPYSPLRPILLAFQPLLLSWAGGGEVKTLRRADVIGVRALTATGFMSGWYMNELLLRLLPREDAHPVLYDAYDTALMQLAAGTRAAGALRRFEWMLLQETGYGVDAVPPDFDDPAVEPQLRYDLRQRLAQHFVGQSLVTRRVLADWQSL
jgi:DNA repair protein RecO (recombination protein O)